MIESIWITVAMMVACFSLGGFAGWYLGFDACRDDVRNLATLVRSTGSYYDGWAIVELTKDWGSAEQIRSEMIEKMKSPGPSKKN